jgi:hypothetical protein
LKLAQPLVRLALPLGRLPVPLLVLVQVPPALLLVPLPLLALPVLLVPPLVPLQPLRRALALLLPPLSLACRLARWLLLARQLRPLQSLQATATAPRRTTDRWLWCHQAPRILQSNEKAWTSIQAFFYLRSPKSRRLSLGI